MLRRVRVSTQRRCPAASDVYKRQLVESAAIMSDGIGDLFVALTSATHDVHVVHAGLLPAGMEEW